MNMFLRIITILLLYCVIFSFLMYNSTYDTTAYVIPNTLYASIIEKKNTDRVVKICDLTFTNNCETTSTYNIDSTYAVLEFNSSRSKHIQMTDLFLFGQGYQIGDVVPIYFNYNSMQYEVSDDTRYNHMMMNIVGIFMTILVIFGNMREVISEIKMNSSNKSNLITEKQTYDPLPTNEFTV